MTGPPKIDDFSFEVPDVGVVAENKKYLTAVKKTIMNLRNSVKIKGTLAAEIMRLHSLINNTNEIDAEFNYLAHPRHLGEGVTCKLKNKHKCLLFDVVLLIGLYQDHIDTDVEVQNKPRLDKKLKHINSILKDGLKAYGVKGDEREGYKLVRR